MRTNIFTILCVAAVLFSLPLLAGTKGSGEPEKNVMATLEFRTFTPDALGGEMPAKRRLLYSKWQARFENTTGQTVDGIHVEFAQPVEEMIRHEAFPEARPALRDKRVWEFTGGTVTSGTTIDLIGYGKKGSRRIVRWWWIANHTVAGRAQKPLTATLLGDLMPMPTAGNVRNAIFQKGGFTPSFGNPGFGLRVGIVRKERKKEFGWVVLKRANNIAKSLYEKGTLHTGAPRGFDSTTAGKKLVGESKFLTPSKHNNRLFAELVALKLNIEASVVGVTPAGFGYLLYNDGGANPLNGLTVTEIASFGDTLMTYMEGRTAEEYANLEATVVKINRAFTGPIDTVSNAMNLRITGMASSLATAFLHMSPENPPVNHYGDGSVTVNEEPATFALGQNYPNPFNPSTTISFTLAERSVVTLAIYNIIGQEVATLVANELLEGGEQEVTFNASGLPSGSYLYRLVASEVAGDGAPAGAQLVSTKSMLLVK